ERPVARRPLSPEREREDSEQRAVKIRAEFVDYLDERALPRGEERHDTSEHAPEAGRQLRHLEIVRVGSLLANMAALNVHPRRRRQRLQLARTGGHGRRKDRGDEQSHHADWRVSREEGREDVVRVVESLACRALDQIARAFANVSNFLIRRYEALFCGGGNIALLSGAGESNGGLLSRSERPLELGVQLLILGALLNPGPVIRLEDH